MSKTYEYFQDKQIKDLEFKEREHEVEQAYEQIKSFLRNNSRGWKKLQELKK